MGSPNLIPVGVTLADLRRAVQKLASLRLNADSTPTFASQTISGLTANRLIASNASQVLVSSDLYSWVTQTVNQVLVADDSDGTITLSLPQDIHTGATPTFADLTLSSPSNIYSLSHDSFADFVASEHLDHALTLDANLIVWLRMDDVDGGGNPVDLGSESMSWTILNDAAQTDDGVIGKAFTFDGTTDAIIGPEPPSGLPLGTASRTIFARVRVDDLSVNRSILYYGDSAGGTGGQWSVLVLTDGKIIIGFVGGSMRTTSTVFNDGKWHSIGMTYDTNDGAAISNIKFYVDGVFDTATNISAIDLDTDNAFLRVGILDNNAAPMNGNIDDVRIYGRSLTADEMLELHQLGTLDAMTVFTAAYFKEYVASRSGYFNRLHVSGSTVTGQLEVTGGLDIDINASNLIGTGDIIPKDFDSQDFGSTAKAIRALYIGTSIFMDDGAFIGHEAGGELRIVFDAGNNFFEFTDGDVVLGGTSAKTRLTVEGTITLKERANADVDTAAYGQLWIKNTTPCEIWFTDDLGNDARLDNLSGTTATAAQLSSLTNNSIVNTLHRHSELVANDGSPDPALSIDATGQVGIGIATPVTNFHVSVDGTVPDASLLTTDYMVLSAVDVALGLTFVIAASAAGERGVFKGVRARGTLETPLVCNNGDNVVSILGAVYDGATTLATAAITFTVDGAVSSGVGPQKISFLTGETNSRTARLIIKADGKIGIGTDSPKTKLTVEGQITMNERSAAAGSNAGYGQLWVKNTTPCELWFTDDTGVDHQIAYI